VSAHDIEPYLEALPLFKELAGQGSLHDLAGICELHRAGAGEVVVTEGSEGDTMYVIKQGRVRVEKRTTYQDTYTVSFLAGGDFLGEAALLNRDRRSATCVAETDCELLVIARPRFLEFGDRHPAAGLVITRKIAGHLAHRLLSANEDIVTLFSALVEEVEGSILGE